MEKWAWSGSFFSNSKVSLLEYYIYYNCHIICHNMWDRWRKWSDFHRFMHCRILAFDEGNRWGMKRKKNVCDFPTWHFNCESSYSSIFSLFSLSNVYFERSQGIVETNTEIHQPRKQLSSTFPIWNKREMEKLPFYYLFTFCDIQLALAFMIGHKSNCKTCEATTNFSRKKRRNKRRRGKSLQFIRDPHRS